MTDTAVRPGPQQPPHALAMQVGESWRSSFEVMQVEYNRLNFAEAQNCLANRYVNRYTSQAMYGYDGSGRNCPRCGKIFVLIEKMRDWADDMRADQEGVWVCEDAECGMRKHEKYRGYGDIFNEN